jgi:hypothetical protein
MGLPARLEPRGLDPKNDLRPDLLLTLPGRHILTDVAVTHPLAPGKVSGKSHGPLATARRTEAIKRKKYSDLVSLRHYEMLPFVMETCGGMGPAAERLVNAMAEAGEAHLAIWAKENIIRELIGSVAIAVQRGGALSYLHGYEQALCKLRVTDGMAAAKHGVGERRSESLDDEDGEEAASAA